MDWLLSADNKNLVSDKCRTACLTQIVKSDILAYIFVEKRGGF